MKLELSVQAARDIAKRISDKHGCSLVVPGTPGYEILRTTVIGALKALPGSPVTDETLDYVERRVSFAIPPISAVKLLGLIPTAGPILADLATRIGADKPVVLVAPEVWDEALTIPAVIAHEIGHCLAILRVIREGGDIGLAVWCCAYGLHASLRASLEACEYTANVSASVIFDEAVPEEAAAAALERLRSYVGDDEAALTIARDTLGSAADSLASGVLHGEGTPFAEVLAEVERTTGKTAVFDRAHNRWAWITSER